MIRLQKFLADCGICSRRKAEEYILEGLVFVNDKKIENLGFKVDISKDKVVFNNKLVSQNLDKVYILLNKPKGVVTTSKDEFNRKTVLDFVPNKHRVVPVGRLDYNTSGLLILTNDGELTYRLTHPKHNIKKTYLAKVKGIPSGIKLESFRNGLKIEDYVTYPAFIKILDKYENSSKLEISIFEGKNRQIRKMCSAIGHEIISLKRVAVENLKLGDLKEGKFRYLRKEEVEYLKKISYLN